MVHPDIIFEAANNDIGIMQRYYKLLENHLMEFGAVFVHLFYGDGVKNSEYAKKYLGWDMMTSEIYKNTLKLLKHNSRFMKIDKNFSISFRDELPLYLIDYHGSTLYFGGGYRDLCVKETINKLDLDLEKLIEELDIDTVCYDPLIINTKYKPFFN